MSAIDRIDRKLGQLRRLEGSYRHEIRRAEEAFRKVTVNKEKALKRLEKFRAKYTRKIERVTPRIRELTLQRAELKA